MMIYEVRADRDVTSKGPEGSGTRRRTVKLPGGPVTLVIGAKPIYLAAEVLPPEIAKDEHILAKEVSAESLAPGAAVIDLKSERVQEELGEAEPGHLVADLKSERVQEELGEAEPGHLVPELKSERVQEELATQPAPPEVSKLKSERVQRPVPPASRRSGKR